PRHPETLGSVCGDVLCTGLKILDQIRKKRNGRGLIKVILTKHLHYATFLDDAIKLFQQRMAKSDDYLRIELRPGIFTKIANYVLKRAAPSVRPIGSHRIKTICQRDYPRSKRNLIP